MINSHLFNDSLSTFLSSVILTSKIFFCAIKTLVAELDCSQIVSGNVAHVVPLIK